VTVSPDATSYSVTLAPIPRGVPTTFSGSASAATSIAPAPAARAWSEFTVGGTTATDFRLASIPFPENAALGSLLGTDCEDAASVGAEDGAAAGAFPFAAAD
jgi:hypothetical protein